ncbi:hypothetical protein ANN_07053 [Periplaneta americana]|uniref:Uncharacterized protein n=1 Tax=Periplaneta americana TaxID=6978 RepID=A0ABQ8TH57_PERAM|nr:hypothetical protein ANN_07053 [Periplaneta americana]
MCPGSSTESYPAFAHIGLRENPGKNLNQVTCPDRESNPGHLVSRLDVLTVTPQQQMLRIWRYLASEMELECQRKWNEDMPNPENYAKDIPQSLLVLDKK